MENQNPPEEGRFRIEDAKLVLPRRGSNALAIMKVSERITEVLQGFDLLHRMAIGETVEINGQVTVLPAKVATIPIVRDLHAYYMGYNNFEEEYDPTQLIRMPANVKVGRSLDIFMEAKNAEGVRFMRDRLEECLLNYREGLSVSPEFISDVVIWALPSPENPALIILGVRIDRFRFVTDEIIDRSDALRAEFPPLKDRQDQATA